MIFLRSHILGFGKLNDRKFEFDSGLNLVFAPNEGGKSTLQRFLLGLLYGQLRSDLRTQRRLDAWVDQYKPWHGSEYGGILWCRLGDNREVEIHRSFGKEETRCEIRSASGEDITRQYDQQRNGEVLFAHSHLGIPKGLFESVGIIRENQVSEIHGYESIRDRIANLAQSGNEELSIRKSLAKIQERVDTIGSDRAPTKPYKQAMDLVQALQDERKAGDERRVQFQGWIEDRNRLAGEITQMERELARTRFALLSARKREMAVRIHSLEEIEGDLHALKSEIESLDARIDFPAERLEELNQLTGAKESIAKHLNEVRSDKANAQAALARAEMERSDVEAYNALAASPEGEKITEWFVTYLTITLQKDGLQKTIVRLQNESQVLQKRLNERSPVLAAPETDWQRMAREAAEDEQLAAQNVAALAGNIAQEKTRLASALRATLNRRILAGVLLGLGAASLIWGISTEFKLFSQSLTHGIWIGLAAVSGIFLALAMKSAKAGHQIEQSLNNLDADAKSIREKGSEKRKEINSVMEDSGFQKLEDFLAAAKQCEQDRQKHADLQSQLSDAEQQARRLQEQLDEFYQMLKGSLAKVGLQCSPGNLKFQIDIFRSNLRRFRELDAHYESCAQRSRSLGIEDANLTNELNEKCSRVESLLELAQVATPEQFREACGKRQKLVELLDRETSRTREFQRLAGALTLPQWKEKLQELIEQYDSQSAEGKAGLEPQKKEETAGALFLPYLPTIAEAEQEEKRIASRLSGAREEFARAVERVKQAFHNFRPSFDIDEDLGIALQKFQELEKNRIALGIAFETIEELSRQQQEVLAPQLNAAVEQRFLRLCQGRYEEVKIDPDFQVWVRETDTGALRLAEYLSRGTQDQIYFAMRFGILDLISIDTEPCPCLLDEPFAAYDRPRLGEAFDVLVEEASRRQLILFTCREDLLDLAHQRNANILHL
jgi:DNA repair exonuclease SbcCD ATPase subunit